MAHAYVPRENEGGNYCGHDPQNPQLSLAIPAPENAPKILSLLRERLPDYFDRPSAIPSLNFANGSTRQQRSERRESCIRVISVLLKYTDIASLRVGVPTADGFMGLTFTLLAKHCGMGLKRLERAVADLKKAGLLTVAPVAEKQPDGSYTSVAAVKAVSQHLWGVFGLLERLNQERAKAAKRVKKFVRKNSNVVTRAKSRGALFLSGLRETLPFSGRQPADHEQRRQVTLRELELRAQHPDWSPDQIRITARQGLV